MKKDAYYFSHDANAQDDPKCMILIDKLGSSGYGIFWLLIEKLRAERDYKLSLNTLEAFAKRWKTTIKKIDEVIKNYDLFVIEEGNRFYSQRLLNSMNSKSEKARDSAKTRWENANAYERIRPHTTAFRVDAIKGKESKVKENKESKVKYVGDSDFEKFWELYDKKVGEKVKLISKWENLTAAEKEKIFEFIPRYKTAQPDKKFRKDPATFLNNKSWNDEIISAFSQKNESNGTRSSKQTGQNRALANYIKIGEQEYRDLRKEDN